MPKTDRQTAKERVRRYLRKNGLTQRALALRLGISEAHLSMILSGHDSPSLDVACAIEAVTGIPPRAFISHAEVAS